ncbi:MAG: bifunctional metallophosphatase/5'-nucleotidase [Opitutaceae bacterium]|nr:bifunctional metallophosphatase/5'-nucleotidase [Opitutaceae bacterium]
MKLRLFRSYFVFVSLVSLVAVAAQAATARLLILHTNDLHDHVRSGYNGVGGLPYVSGYVAQVRAGRDDVLLLDAGDVTEKGDLVAFRTNYEMTYEAMRRIGYDGVTIGNHDYDDVGEEGVRRYEKVLGQPLLCINILKADGTPQFLPSRIVERGGLKIGIIGAIVPRKERCLDVEATGRAIAAEAERLDREAHVVVVVCHEGVKNCERWSQLAPAVDVFVSGHTHQALARPVVVAGTGARIVQAGSYARTVGRLELQVDPVTEEIVAAQGELVPMRHDTVPVDEAMLAWVRAREQELCPEAGEFVIHNPADLDGFAVARLGAEAYRRAAGTELGFCTRFQVIREILPAGDLDVNALFLAGGQRGHETVRTELTGAEITAYLNALARQNGERTEWAGFRVRGEPDPAGGERVVTDLDPARRYRVLMARIEWETRFQRVVARTVEKKLGGPLAAREFTATPTEVTFTGAMRAYLGELAASGVSLPARAAELAARQSAEAR